MTELTWDAIGVRTYETGVDHGVLYIPDNTGAYTNGVAWNGLTTVTESPSGAEASPQYADNIKYLNLFSAEQFGATIQAFTYPDEFAQFDGLGVPTPGVTVGQQRRKTFGFAYRTKLGNDVEGDSYAYKHHLVWGCTAAPSEKAYSTINDSPEAIDFSWALTTVAVDVPGYSPTSIITITSSEVDATALADLETVLYGSAGVDPRLPSPGEVISFFDNTVVEVTPSVPTFAGNVITIPTVAGVTYYINGLPVVGTKAITANTIVTARPNSGYTFADNVDDDWLYTYS